MKFATKTLGNGLRVIAVPMQNTETVTVLMLIGTGSHYENRKNNGVSHFLEHMFFKGTKKYPDAGMLNKQLDVIGAQHNAFTSREETGYWVKAHAKHFPLAIGFVADILQNALLEEKEIDRERGVILEEMKMYFDTPRLHVWNIFERLLYGNQPAGWDIIGTPDTLRSIKRKTILEYKKRHYNAKNAVLIIAGNKTEKEIFASAQKEFRRLRSGVIYKKPKVQTPQKGPRVQIETRVTDQTHLILGVKGFSYRHKDRFTAEILSMILGGYMSSRLFMKIRERKGLAYSVSATHQSYIDSGFLGIYAGIPHAAHVEVPRYIVEEFESIRKKGVTREELKRAKEHTRGRLAIGLESTDEVASFLGAQELIIGTILSPAQLLQKIDKITERDIQKVAQKIFTPSNYYLACIGSQIDKAQFLKTIQ